jgi:hypothetical protein
MSQNRGILLKDGVIIAYYTGKRDSENERIYGSACGCCCFEIALEGSRAGLGVGETTLGFRTLNNLDTQTPKKYRTLKGKTVYTPEEGESVTCTGVFNTVEGTVEVPFAGGTRTGLNTYLFPVPAPPANNEGFYCEDGGGMSWFGVGSAIDCSAVYQELVESSETRVVCKSGAENEKTLEVSDEITYSQAEQWAKNNFDATENPDEFVEDSVQISTAGHYGYITEAAVSGSSKYRIKYKPSPTGYLRVWLARRRNVFKYSPDIGIIQNTEIDKSDVVLEHTPTVPCNDEYLYSDIYQTGDLIFAGGIINTQYEYYSKDQTIFILAYSFLQDYDPTVDWNSTNPYQNLKRNGFPSPQYAPPPLMPFPPFFFR